MLNPTEHHVIYAALLAAAIAAAAGVLRLLTLSGAVAAFAVGFFIFAAGGVPLAVPLLVFFFTSSLLSHIGVSRKAAANARSEKGRRRDAWQVIANGVIPALLAVAYHTSHHARESVLLYLAALAAMTADTWATEIGGLWPGRPRLVTTLRHVEPGTSGAVTLVGLLASVAGAAAIAAGAWAVWPLFPVELRYWRIDLPEILTVVWAGTLASYGDSILGASIQGQYRCARCGAPTEQRAHCRVACKRTRGLPWVNNDVVNLLASTLGVGFAYVILRFYAYP